jgi:hypothetical protein
LLKIHFINQTGNEELTMFNNPFRNIFDYKLKKKLLCSIDDLNILYETYIKPQKAEDIFWKEFLKNQKKNQTEIIGGLKKVFFSTEEEKNIEKEKKKNHPIQNSVKNSSSQILNIQVFNQAIQKYKISERFENIERHKYYSHKYFGPCFKIAEYDYKDRVIKDLSAEEEFDRKEMDNFISSINEYSKRKMENINYIPKNNFNCIISKFKIKNTSIRSLTNKTMNFEEKVEDTKQKSPRENYSELRKRLGEMKAEHTKKIKSENMSESKKESVIIFKKVRVYN